MIIHNVHDSTHQGETGSSLRAASKYIIGICDYESLALLQWWICGFRAAGGVDAERAERLQVTAEEEERQRTHFASLQQIRKEGFRKVCAHPWHLVSQQSRESRSVDLRRPPSQASTAASREHTATAPSRWY